MFVNLKARSFLLENTETFAQRTVAIAFEEDGSLVVVDGDSSDPVLIGRVQMACFPTDDAIISSISGLLGSPHALIRVLDQSLELDSSALAGLHKMPVDIFDNVYLDEVKNDALILCVDIRNFSNFLRNNREDEVFRLIKDFTSNFLSCVNQFAFGCSWYKLLGDGALVIWDYTTRESVAEALQVFDTYTEFVNEELFKPYPGLGLGGALVAEKVFKYEISAEASQLKYRDYVGYGINLCCRLQGLAQVDRLILNRKLACTGFLPYIAERSEAFRAELRIMKGLKPEDCEEVLYYDPSAAP